MIEYLTNFLSENLLILPISLLFIFYMSIKANRILVGTIRLLWLFLTGILTISSLIYGIVLIYLILSDGILSQNKVHIFEVYFVISFVVVSIAKSIGNREKGKFIVKYDIQQSEFFKKTFDLMCRDALYADLMWRYAFKKNVTKQTDPKIYEEAQKIPNPVKRISEELGFDFGKYNLFLDQHIEKIIHFYSETQEYASRKHLISLLGFPFRKSKKGISLFSGQMRDFLFIAYAKLIADILIPVAAFLGYQFAPLYKTGTMRERLLLMLVGFYWLLKAEFVDSLISDYEKSIKNQKSALRFGKKLHSPVRDRFYQDLLFSIAVGMVVISVGTFIEHAYSGWELLIAFSTLGVIVKRIIRRKITLRPLV